MDPVEFKRVIKQLGFTQAEFASYIEVGIRTVNDWGSETRKRGRGAQSDDDTRLGPPPYIVRLLRHMQRGHIPVAPVIQSVETAMTELSLAMSAVIGDATAAGWDYVTACEAIKRLAEQRLELHAQSDARG